MFQTYDVFHLEILTQIIVPVMKQQKLLLIPILLHLVRKYIKNVVGCVRAARLNIELTKVHHYYQMYGYMQLDKKGRKKDLKLLMETWRHKNPSAIVVANLV